jgi:carbon-monoxide dehydrogenase medium subunit
MHVEPQGGMRGFVYTIHGESLPQIRRSTDDLALLLGTRMKPPEFEYHRPESIPEAVAALGASDGEGKVLAGGQSLVPLMNFRLASPKVLIDLNRVADLMFLERTDETLRIGAMTRTRALEINPVVRTSIPILAASAHWIGHVQIRNRGTVGGSLAHADPAAELPAICLLLDAELVATGPRGERTIPAAEFFVDFLETSLDEDEILTEIRFPVSDPRDRWGFREFAQRRGDYALAGAAVVLRLGPRQASEWTLERARIVVFGTADRPVRSISAEALLAREPAAPAVIAEAARLAADDIAADDPRPDASYRRKLTETLVRRALEDAAVASPDADSSAGFRRALT